MNKSIYNLLKNNDDLPMHLKSEKIGDILMGEQKEYISKNISTLMIQMLIQRCMFYLH